MTFPHFHIHITEHEIQEGLGVVSHLAGNSVLGNGASAISHGIDTYNDIESHNVLGALKDGAETAISGGEAVVDGFSGDWL
jgi:hypothetical protein